MNNSTQKLCPCSPKAKLRSNPDLLELVFMNTPVCVVVLDTEFNFIRVNEAYAKMCNRNVEDFSGHNHFELFPSNTREIFENVVKTKQPFDIPARAYIVPGCRKVDKTYWNWNLTPILDDAGEVDFLFFALRDVTDRFKVERAIKEQNDMLEEQVAQRTSELEKTLKDLKQKNATIKYAGVQESVTRAKLLDKLPCVALIIKKGTREIVASNEIARKIGAVPGETCHKICSERDTPCTWCLAPDLWETNESKHIEIEHRGKHYEGYWGDLTEDLYIHYIFDITERKQAEMALLTQHNYLAKAQEMGKIGTWELDIAKNELLWTDETYRVFGLPIGTELTYEIFLGCVHPDDREYVDKKWMAALAGEHYDIKHRLIVDGRVKWVREKAELEFDDNGNCTRGIGFTQDITERKKAQDDILQSRILLKSSIESPKDMIILSLDREYRYLYFNETHAKVMAHVYGKQPQIGDCIFNHMKGEDDIKKLKDHYDRALVGEGHVAIEEYGEGQLRTYYEIRYNPIYNEENKIIGVTAFAQDITERKQAQDALRESEILSRSLLDGSPVCNKIIDLDCKLRYMSAAGIKHLKIPDIKPYYGQSYPPEFYPESMRASLIQGLKKAIAGEINSMESPVHDMEGNEVWYHTTFAPALDDDGRVKYIISSSVNITDNKLAEEEIAQLAKFPDENPNPVMRIHKDGTILYANDACNPVFATWGVEKGQRLPEHGIKHVQKAFRSGKPYVFEDTIDGRTYLMTFAPVVESDYLNAYAIDITDRKQAEEELRNEQMRKTLATELSLAEEQERQRLSEGLHDSVGQYLASLKIELDLLKRTTDPYPEIDSALDEIIDTAKKVISETRALTFEICPPFLHELGLEQTLEWLGEQFQNKHGIAFEFINDGQRKPLEDNMRALLFRMTRELLMNIGKHSRAKNATTSTQVIDNCIQIIVEDDGVGFDILNTYSNNKIDGCCLGLHSIRERLNHLGGKFDLESNPGRGTKITLELPLHQQ